MSDITVTIDGVADVITALEAIKHKIDRATYVATDASGRLLQNDARRNFSGTHAPGWWHVGGNQPNTVTGHLQQSIQFLTPTHSSGPGEYSNRSGPQAVYSRVIELGAKIDAQTAQYLHWFDEQFGVDRFKKSVTVPPRPYFTPARMSLAPKAQAIFYREWSNAWSV